MVWLLSSHKWACLERSKKNSVICLCISHLGLSHFCSRNKTASYLNTSQRSGSAYWERVIRHGAEKNIFRIFWQPPFGGICLNLFWERQLFRGKKCIHWVKDGNYISSTTQKSIKHHNLSVAAVVNGWWLASSLLGWLRQNGPESTLKSRDVWSEACALLSLALTHDFPPLRHDLCQGQTVLFPSLILRVLY